MDKAVKNSEQLLIEIRKNYDVKLKIMEIEIEDLKFQICRLRREETATGE